VKPYPLGKSSRKTQPKRIRRLPTSESFSLKRRHARPQMNRLFFSFSLSLSLLENEKQIKMCGHERELESRVLEILISDEGGGGL